MTIHRIAFRVGFSITTTIGALVFVRGLFLSVVRCFFTVVVGIKWIEEAAVRYHAQDGTEGTPGDVEHSNRSSTGFHIP